MYILFCNLNLKWNYIKLPYEIIEDEGTATFDRKNRKLVLNLPVVPQKELLVEVYIIYNNNNNKIIIIIIIIIIINYIILHYVILYYIILHYVILYYIILYYIIL